MISTEKYEYILSEGLLLDHYFLLCNMNSGNKMVQSKRIQGFTNLLIKKGYIEGSTLTDKALVLIQGADPIPVENIKTVDKPDFGTWAIDIHKKCELKIFQLTGNKQVRAKINGKSYSFLPNQIDLAKVLYRVIVTYKIKDFQRVEKCLLKYIEECYDKKNWFPILQYYISKNGKSDLVTDIESDDNDKPDFKSLQKLL